MDTESHERVPENAPGDFYIERHICMKCCIPHAEAPELMNDPSIPFDECFFRRQPRTDEEVQRACRVVWISCVGALRYAGKSPEILKRLRELGMARQCYELE